MLHISVASNSESHFEFARVHINENGGIAENFLFNPPNTIPLNEVSTDTDKIWEEELQSNPVLIPNMHEFREKLKETVGEFKSCKDDIFNLAMKVLIDPGIHGDWAASIVKLLVVS